MRHPEDRVRRRLGDRRGRPRFDIVGDLWGTLETAMRLPLQNIGRGGALIHSHVPLPPESVHTLTLSAAGRDLTTEVKVRHVNRAVTPDGEQTFLIGVEFLSSHSALLAHIEEFAVVPGGTSPAEV